ncbi:MAG: transcriptional repressor LexA [Nitrospirae bacterium]|nr:transcriptional repressor LexA [Nitrospirota bacterium]
MLTKRQKQALDFITSFRNKKGLSPSLEEIKKHLKLSSVSTAHHHVKKLQESGYLQKEYNQPRALSPVKEKSIIEVSLVGTIAAGQPIEPIEAPNEIIAISKDEVGTHGKHYALRVQGNSMIDEGIFDGDIVIIRKQEFADNGQTVVAIIDDNQATLKKIYRERDRIRLQPANPTLFPFYREDVEIRGIVVKIIRNLETQIEKERVKDEKYVRRIDYSWDYKGENTKQYTHGIHTYPAMFIPQVARRLLETYSQKGDTICDIFCGSGTALVESKLLGRNAYGIDLNPLAILLARVKTTPINPSLLTKAYFKLLSEIDKVKGKEVHKPNFNNIDFWFKEDVILQLAKIKDAILKIENSDIRNFFMIPFSESVRLSSNTKSGEFKLVRISRDKLENYCPDVLGIFRKRTELNIKGMADFYKEAGKDVFTKIIYGDSAKDNKIKDNSIDFILTSPPYGDSRTTVAYGQFSRLSAQWANIFDDPNKASGLDNELLGGKATKTIEHHLLSNYLKESLDKIIKRDEKRAKEVLSFYIGLNTCLRQAHRILKPKKYFCIVIGNRMVKQVRIPTDFIIAELSESIGFTCEDIFVRNIPGKRMPMKNSPTNIVGALEETMNKESIVVLRKD